MVKKEVVRITGPMAELITGAVLRGTDYVVRGRSQVEDGLVKRGLVEAHQDYLRLTADGRWVHGYITAGGKRLGWHREEMPSGSVAPTIKPRCGRTFVLAEDRVCKRQTGHLGLHNPLDGSEIWWGDNECGPAA